MKVIPQVHRRSAPALEFGGIELKKKCSGLSLSLFSFLHFLTQGPGTKGVAKPWLGQRSREEKHGRME